MTDQENDVLDRFRQLMEDKQIAIDTASAVIGGEVRWLFEPPPHESFLKAARAVLESGHKFSSRPSLRTGFQEIATPCGYLQRHALELIIKEYWYLAGTLGEKLGLPPLDPDEVFGHRFKDLVRGANKRMAALPVRTRQLALSPDIEVLANEIATIEAGNDAAFRYVKGKGGAPSIPKPTIVPLADWQKRLEGIAKGLDLTSSPDDFHQLSAFQWMGVYEALRGQNPEFTM